MAVEPLAELDELEPGAWVDELGRIWKKDGELTTVAVERAARNPSNPLHALLPWDDKVAGYQYRLIVCGRLIRRAQVILTIEDNPPVKVRAYLHTSQNYQPTARVLSNAGMRQEVFGRMRTDMEILVRRYEKYERIAEMKEALRELRAWLKTHS